MGTLATTAHALCKSATGVALASLTAASSAPAQELPVQSSETTLCTSWSPAAFNPGVLFECFYRASRRVARVAPHQISFQTEGNARQETAASFANAVTTAGDALVNVAERPGGKSALSKIDEVLVGVGGKPSAKLHNRALTITIVPSRGAAGIPSSDKMERVIIWQWQQSGATFANGFYTLRVASGGAPGGKLR